MKKLFFEIKQDQTNFVIVLVGFIEGKAGVAIAIDEGLIANSGLDAGKIIKQIVAPLIQGGGGGQKTLATAGGQDITNLDKVIEKVKEFVQTF